MQYPNFNEEKKLWRCGFKFVAGLDEAGRGPLAGPVVAAAVSINLKRKAKSVKQQLKIQNLKLFGVRDSKKLSARKREELFEILTDCDFIEWGIGIVSEKIIDKINILEATKLAMEKAVCDANIRMHTNNTNKKIDYLVLDGNFKINSRVPQKSIIKGDEKVFSCAAASIIAKVTRDRIMLKYDKKYPQCGFKNHKGYPTKSHSVKLKKYGVCEIHRKSFAPIIKIINQSTEHSNR